MTTRGTSNPPLNRPAGGQWGTLQYAGGKTCATIFGTCFVWGIFSLLFLNCPIDEKDAYCVNEKLYDSAGLYIGLARDNNNHAGIVLYEIGSAEECIYNV